MFLISDIICFLSIKPYLVLSYYLVFRDHKNSIIPSLPALPPPRRRRMRAMTSSTPSTATWTVVGAPALMARACTTTKVPLRTRRSCVRFTRGSLRLSDGRLAPRPAGAALVLVWNATPWGGAIRAANAIPLLFSSYVDSSLHT